MEEKYIYIFLDFLGTISDIFNSNEKQVLFFSCLDKLEERYKAKALVFVIFEQDCTFAKQNISKIASLFYSYKRRDTFVCGISEFSGQLIFGDKVVALVERGKELDNKKQSLENLARRFDGSLNNEIKSYFEFLFLSITNDRLLLFESECKNILYNMDEGFNNLTINKDGECKYLILPKNNTKGNAVKFLYKKFSEKFLPKLILLAGDEYEKDYSMFIDNEEYFTSQGVTSIFIALGIENLSSDKQVIKEKEGNTSGLVNAINKVIEL